MEDCLRSKVSAGENSGRTPDRRAPFRKDPRETQSKMRGEAARLCFNFLYALGSVSWRRAENHGVGI